MKRLKELRLEKKLYQKDVASAIGIDRTTYVKYELGQSEPNHEILQRIADFFDVSIDYLMCRTDIKKAPSEKPEVTDDDIQFALFGGKVTDEAYEDVKRFAQFIKEKYKDKE